MGCGDEGADFFFGEMIWDYEVAVLIEEVDLGLGEPWGGGWAGHALF